MTQQYQRFRKADIIEEVGVRIASISASNGDSSYYVCLQDIQDVFPDAQRFKLDGHPILFLQDSNGNRIEPPRIAFYPDKILDVITAEPQACNCNSSSNSSTSASSNSMAVISLSALGVPTNLASQDILPIIKLEKSNMVIDLLLEARKKDDEMLKLQREATEKDNEIIKLQREAEEKNDKMLKLQQEAVEKSNEMLKLLLPVDTTKWDPRNILRSKVRLRFLCECGEHTATISKSNQNQIHIAKHEGYDIRNSTEFFRKYGKYMLILLHSLKMGMPLTTSLTPTPNLDAGIDYAIKYMEALSNEYPVLSKINKIDECEALEGADLRQLGKFLENNDEGNQLGNLYRITTETGHVKWVCFDHYRWTYGEAERRVFKKVVELNGGEYNLHLGKVIITLKSKTTAEEFFNALANARRVYELDIIFDWNWTKADLEGFEEALKKSSVSALRLELGEFQERTTEKLLSTTPRYGMLVHITELSSMKTIHIVLPPNTIKAPSLQLSRSPHLQKLTIEMKPRFITTSGLQSLANILKADTAITMLNLRDNSVMAGGALALSEALKANRCLTTLNLRNNLIGDEGVMALSEGLKANRTLITLDLMGNSIRKEGALALLEVLKTNTTLVTLDLDYDSLGKEGILLLSKTNTTLTSLSFSSKEIGDEGALVLSEALKANTALTTLNLQPNLIGNEGALALSEALKANTALTTLNLDGNSIGDEGALALSEALKANTTLTCLNLGFNSIGDEGALALSEALKANTTLTTLDLDGNFFESEGALALSEALKVNTTLTCLDLPYKSIRRAGALALSEARKTNATLAIHV
ncbi:hypothetical protein BCR41DRAFT_422319 [Lobosporangium transversale]|uniref:RNI-like protein n=1 Tax=Lobosporangium transversale TaxID=64571 RepID=A0A1Y2GMM1_9FUNG|nr:hypothetical protein BCR41DRAFT_422319 [Lobosporangium transversale]ORZ15556.1 hypothetical protein BCR41DRAFT_422319 [Lobosporangium transversale]|eukprot:XP_021881304.1 hypothetical protein BCR41DRAFT_422319 [Lobosporangium transversale]